MGPADGDAWWGGLSEQLDHAAVVDRAISVLMRDFGCGYWTAMRVLHVDAIRQRVDVRVVARRVLQHRSSLAP